MGSSGSSRLTGWKEIANHLDVTVRTAQLWEKNRGLPVHRLPGGGKPSVFSTTEELEAWVLSNPDEPPPEPYGLRLPTLSDQPLDVAACVLENNGLIGIQRLLAVARRTQLQQLAARQAGRRPGMWNRLVRRLGAWSRAAISGD